MTMTTGVCLWLTGKSGAGKTTVTRELVSQLEARGRTVTVLDVVPELAKHWAERTSEGKLVRKAYVSSEVVRHGGIAICVTISGKAAVRARARDLVGPEHFIEIYFDAPDVVMSERRAARTKNPPLLKRLRRLIRRLRRLGRRHDSYERPASPDLTLRSSDVPPAENAERIVELLARRGFLEEHDVGSAPRGPAGAGDSGSQVA